MNNSKKQLLIIVTASLLIAVLSIFISLSVFVSKAIREQSEANDLLSIYEKTDYKYIIKNPSSDQIIDFESNSLIKKVVPYYQLVYIFDISNNKIEITLRSIENLQDLNYTEFSEERLIENKEVDGNKIYLDYSMAKMYNLKVGDSIGSNVMQFIIAGFYQSYDSHLAFVPNLKNIVKNDLCYEGVYIDTDNNEDFLKGVLNSYKPLATLKERELFSDDKVYQDYLSDFNSRDYSSYIIEKNIGYKEKKESYDNKIANAKFSYITSGFISALIILLGLITLSVLFIRKIKYEIVDGARKRVVFRYTLGAIVALAGVIISWVAGAEMIMNSQIHFIRLSNVLSLGWTSLLIPVFSVIVGMIVNIFIVQGSKEKQEDKNK